MTDVLAEWEFVVEAGKIAEFARAVGDTARADPHLAPPTFLMVAGAGMIEGLILNELKLDRARTLHGTQGWEYLAPVRAGMRLRCTARLTGDVVKPGRDGGRMRVVTLEILHSDAATGTPVARETMTTVETGQP